MFVSPGQTHSRCPLEVWWMNLSSSSPFLGIMPHASSYLKHECLNHGRRQTAEELHVFMCLEAVITDIFQGRGVSS